MIERFRRLMEPGDALKVGAAFAVGLFVGLGLADAGVSTGVAVVLGIVTFLVILK